jgi:hypothetical protein
MADTKLSAVTPPSTILTVQPLRDVSLPSSYFDSIDVDFHRFVHPSQMLPYGAVDQRTVRKTIYSDPLKCPMTGLLTPGQMQAAEQACLDRFFNTDHSD